MSTDWLMVIITAVYVIATIAISIFNWKASKAARDQVATSKEQVQKMIEQFNSVNRPIISIRFDVIRSGLLCFVIKNIGPLPAVNFRMSINEQFIDNIPDNKIKEGLMSANQSELYLSPQQEVFILLGGQPEFNKISKEKAVLVSEYNGFHEETEINLNEYKHLLVYDSPIEDIVQLLKTQNRETSAFREKLLKSFNK